MDRYRILSHTADTAIEAEAPSIERLIENLAFGMFDLMFDLAVVEPLRLMEIEVRAPTLEDLVVDVLADLLYEAERADMAFCSLSARIDTGKLTARILASGSSVADTELTGPPIKAVTYHDLVVESRETGWYGRVVFDV